MMHDKSAPSQQPQQATSSDATADRRQIAERAYYRYVERGRADGKAVDDWLSAETELRQRARPRVD